MEKMVSYKVTVRCNDSAVLGVEQRNEKGSAEVNILSHFAFFLPRLKGVVEVTYSSGRVIISSKEEQIVIRQNRGAGRFALLEEEEEEEEEELGWKRVNGRLERAPNTSASNTSSTRGEKVIFWQFFVFGKMHISGNSESSWFSTAIGRWWWRAWASSQPRWRSGAWASWW